MESYYNCNEKKYFVKYCYHYYQNQIDSRGCPGPKGEKGDKGETGAQGPKGDKGDVGPQGSKGDKGDVGPQGPEGDKGDRGETGAQGPKGDKGDKGETGAQGPKGDKGDVGPQGPEGDKGETGAQGPKGDKGDKGETGAQGSKGDKGDKGETGAQGSKGDKGDVGPQGPEGDKGETGAQGPKGDKGDKGETGAQGPEGVLFSEYGFASNMQMQIPNISIPTSFPDTHILSTNISVNPGNTVFTIHKQGVYLISYQFNLDGEAGAYSVLNINGTGYYPGYSNMAPNPSRAFHSTVLATLNAGSTISVALWGSTPASVKHTRGGNCISIVQIAK